MSTQQSDNLFILLISDIHESTTNLQKAIDYCKSKKFKFDYIFCLGDMVSIDQGEQDDKTICNRKEKEIQSMFINLETLPIKNNLIYLPGNHDPSTLYSDSPPQFTYNSINLHLKSLKIKDDLLLVGCGGSTCAISSDETLYHSYQNLDTKNIIRGGYPYIDNMTNPNYEKSDELLKNDLNKLDNIINEFNGDILLITHMGPFTLNTSNQYLDNKVTYSGSQSLNDFILKYENKIIGNIHGHSHKGVGMGKLHNIKIFNPGCLNLNYYGFLYLAKNEMTNYKWKINKIELMTV